LYIRHKEKTIDLRNPLSPSGGWIFDPSPVEIDGTREWYGRQSNENGYDKERHVTASQANDIIQRIIDVIVKENILGISE
jgi:hypothetical protein